MQIVITDPISCAQPLDETSFGWFKPIPDEEITKKSIDLGNLAAGEQDQLRSILSQHADAVTAQVRLSEPLLNEIVTWYANGFPKNDRGIDDLQAAQPRDSRATTPWRLKQDLASCLNHHVKAH